MDMSKPLSPQWIGQLLKPRPRLVKRTRKGALPTDPMVNGWMAYTQWHNDPALPNHTPIIYFESAWVVPKEPTNQTLGQIVFFFNGLEPEDGSHILQPVLQWGADSNDGVGSSDGWYVTSWYATCAGGPFTATTGVKVNVGDRLVGAMTLLDSPSPIHPTAPYKYSCQFFLTTTDPNGNETSRNPIEGTYLEVPNATFPTVNELTYAYHTLEAYTGSGASLARLTNCDGYPSASADGLWFESFSNIVVKTFFGAQDPVWIVSPPSDVCSIAAAWGGSFFPQWRNTSTLYFRKEPFG